MNIRISNNTTQNVGEKGIALATTALFIVLLLMFVAFVATMGYRRLVRTELQNAVDGAALAGAAAIGRTVATPPFDPLCTSSECYQDAQGAAIETLRMHRAHGKLGSSAELQIDPAGAPNWVFPEELEVSIERGRWTTLGGFEPFEYGWGQDHPGIPDYIAANAVRVRAKRPGILPLFSFFPNISFDVEVDAIGVADDVSVVQVAPFAIPVCALLTDGEFDPEKVCTADRLITGLNRHCPAGNPDCGVVPDFDWDPTEPEPVWPHEPIGPSEEQDLTCSWPTPHFEKFGDNYGVVGQPGPWDGPPPLDERVIQQQLAANPGIDAKIGDAYWLVADGLTRSTTHDIIWNQITNQFAGSGESHPDYQDTDLGDKNTNSNWAFMEDVDDDDEVDMNNRITDCSVDNPAEHRFIPPRWQRPSWGTCNSVRSGWGLWDRWIPGQGCPDSYDPLDDGQQIIPFGNIPVWRVDVAVIGDPAVDALPCQGVGQSLEDPVYEDIGPYEVIGFVKLLVYDVDIGADPPSYPHICADPYPDFGQGVVTTAFPWGYQGIVGSAPRCNIVRTRIACDTRFIPASKGRGKREPVLVD